VKKAKEAKVSDSRRKAESRDTVQKRRMKQKNGGQQRTRGMERMQKNTARKISTKDYEHSERSREVEISVRSKDLRQE